jgi:replication initiation and membrane attachment protein DnaB
LQQDSDFNKDYKDLEKFDDGSVKSKLIGRDSKPMQFKSWVVWVKNNNQVKSIDWSVIEKNGYVLKEFGNTTSLIISNDKQSVFAFDLNSLVKALAPRKISSVKVQSTNFDIISNLGETYRYDYKGIVQNFKDSTIQLKQIQCTQEFKHSFEDFQLLNNH